MNGGPPLPFGLDHRLLDRVSPFWFLFDRRMRIAACGPSFAKLFPGLELGKPLASGLLLVRPGLDHEFDRWIAAQGRVFILKEQSRGVVLRGEVVHSGGDVGLFLGTPWLTDASELQKLGLTLADFAVSDPVVDLLQLFQSEKIALQESRALAVQLQVTGSDLDALNRELSEKNANLQKTESLLRETSAREQAILESALEGIITIDEGGVVVACNPATERMFGHPRSWLVGQNVSVLMAPPHAERHDSYIRAYLETGRSKVIGHAREVPGLRQDGTIFPIELSLAEVRLHDRRLFTGIVRDITEKKRAESEAKKFLAELESSRGDLLTVLNQMRAGTVVIDDEGRVLFLSDSCPIESGLERASALGLPWYQVVPLEKASRELVRGLLRLPEEERTRAPLQCRLKDGRHYHLEGDVRDFPGDAERRIIYLYDISELHDLKRKLSHAGPGAIVGESGAMLELYRKIQDVAAGDWTVLIEGETGSGKELVARAIHAASDRREGPFIPVNCAGLAESLLASQLFGHVRGAFTGAVTNQEGVFEAASGGTLFLDEIGDISAQMQSAILRALQEREIVRVGESRPRKVNVRVLAATHRDLGREVAEGRFRQDLLFRIRVARVKVPALRERVQDIPLLAASFLAEFRASTGKLVTGITEEAVRLLRGYEWPGNVRELKSALESAAIHCKGPVIQAQDLPLEVRAARLPPQSHGTDETPDGRARIMEALRECDGHRGKAALMLGMSRATFYRKLAKLNFGPKKTS